ncbi:MAG: hypothetical protein FJY95_06750 [Candidatus Handelsmanbacteria bacterium]|nr:hypothetical protein [Candidatus Handelsmanbacteria bacterium]
MIAGLRERERIKTIFGKYVNSTVATQILGQDGGADLEGRRWRWPSSSPICATSPP